MSEVEDLTAEHREFAAEVNGHLTKVTDDLRQVSGWAGETGPVIESHTDALAEHAEQLEKDTELLAGLREDINAILKELRRKAKYQPIDWRALTAEEAEVLWVELGEWVSAELVDVYSASRAQLPDCWPLHPAAVRHLSWLWTAYQAAYDQAAGPNPAAEWNVRWHGDGLAELQASVLRDTSTRGLRKCSLGMHFDQPLPGVPGAPQPGGQVPPRVPVGHAPGQQQGPGPYGPPPMPGTPAPWQQQGPPQFEPRPGTAPLPVPPGGQPSGPNYTQDDPAGELARREFWWPQLVRAREVDVAARRETERLAKEAAEQEAANN
ncbi:hypothetical protein [Amycolatopsis sp. NBC_01480]|uniref:hypothetical protein n=1 Tax=Amycolatopsis sp. NBC_01480 TaxID=2903562 RepID=UPI002E2AEECD|nr:hypothetical protein [Amycolatopsis sp. NBC_01480]